MTPLLKQYWEIKNLHPDKILFFRMGDFYELFFDDAVKAAPLLGITLTQRNKKSEDQTPMCGVPHHSVAGHINSLLKKGHKVAMCDQIEDAKLAKGLVKRAVTRVLTPGMVYDLETLDGQRPHYLMSFDEKSISYVDTTTGESFYFERQNEEIEKWMGLLPAAEIVVSPEQRETIEEIKNKFEHDQVISVHTFSKDGPVSVWGKKLKSEFCSQDRILSYVHELSQEQVLGILKPFERRSWSQALGLSPMVVRHLEFFQTYTGAAEGSFFNAINLTKTSAGTRRLRQWLLFPLTNEKLITERQNKINFWRSDVSRLKKLREIFAHLGDIERRLAKISLVTGHARDVQSLGQAIETGLSAFQISEGIGSVTSGIRDLANLAEKISNTIVEEPPLSTKQGNLIKCGVHPTLDEYIDLTTDSQSLLAQMESNEREKTGISSLKIRYNQVFGYYLEVTNTHKEKVPASYRRKQTLANAERYTTDALDELEKKVITAQTKRNDLEAQIFEELRQKVLSLSAEILTFASDLADLDTLSSLAWLATERNYVCPKFHASGDVIIKSSRHPVVEKTTSHFVANDIILKKGQCLLLTGPNMAGKSTLMRQVALTSILAQIGSFVPADEAVLPIFDQIFTRIGASDQLSQGLSTFMVEMTETAEILKSATQNSLVVLDEIGRGTSTYDGMSLAQGILEYIVKKVKCLTFFATHYHEMTSLEATFPNVLNAHMAVSERKGEINFLHTLATGPARRSYGIQVAQRAGLPEEVTSRAKTLLKKFEDSSHSPQMMLFATSFSNVLSEHDETNENQQVSSSLHPLNVNKVLISSEEKLKTEVFNSLSEIDINQLTPMAALLKISEIKNKYKI